MKIINSSLTSDIVANLIPHFVWQEIFVIRIYGLLEDNGFVFVFCPHKNEIITIKTQDYRVS